MGFECSAFLMNYIITVFLKQDYSKSETFVFNTDNPVTKFEDQGRLDITEEVNQRYPEWYYYDIEVVQ